MSEWAPASDRGPSARAPLAGLGSDPPRIETERGRGLVLVGAGARS
jgi:hypothetical protein